MSRQLYFQLLHKAWVLCSYMFRPPILAIISVQKTTAQNVCNIKHQFNGLLALETGVAWSIGLKAPTIWKQGVMSLRETDYVCSNLYQSQAICFNLPTKTKPIQYNERHLFEVTSVFRCRSFYNNLSGDCTIYNERKKCTCSNGR